VDNSRKFLIALPILALLAFPAFASAKTQVSVVTVAGVGKVLVVNDDDSSGVITIEHNITPPPDNVRYVAVGNPDGLEVGAGCAGDPP
jgi:hypothetical protein